MQSYVLHLECSRTGTVYSADQIHNLSDDGMPLLVRYDLDRIKQELSKDSWCVGSAPGFWRYQALLPVSNAASKISLGEVITPLIPLKESSKLLGGKPENIIQFYNLKKKYKENLRRNLKISNFFIFYSGAPIWLFLNSDSDSACRDFPGDNF